jgi:diacylglycerol O-acyltransferase
MKQLSGVDASFLYGESDRMPLHTIKVAILELPHELGHAELRRQIAAHFALLPALQKRLVWVPGGIFHPRWRDGGPIDIDQHLRFVALEREDALDQTIAAVAEGMLPRDRPLWQLTLVSGVGPRRLAAILKIHHALADGAAVARMLRRLTTLAPACPMDVAPPASEPVPTRVALFGAGLLARFRQLITLPLLLARTWHGRLRTERRPKLLFRGPRLRMNGKLVRTRRFMRFHMPLDRFRAAAKVGGGSVNDLIFTVAAGAFRQWLTETKEDVSRPLVASMPVAVAGEHLIGNQVSNLFVPIPVHLATPKERLDYVRRQIAAAKAAHRRRGDSLFSEWAELSFPLLQRRLWNNFVLRFKRSPINLVLSNVPGPKRARYVGAARLVELYSVGPLMQRVGVNLTIWSYAGRLYFSLLSTPSMEPRRRLPELFARALSELEASLAAGGLAEQAPHAIEGGVALPRRDHPAR